MNKIDKDYQDLLKDILDNGVIKETRNGKTISVFGRQIRHKMSTGFPLITTKKMYFKGIVTELLWFLRGETQIKYLLDNDCNIWTGDAYQHYLIQDSRILPNMSKEKTLKMGFQLSKEEFVDKIKNDNDFAKKCGSLGKIYGYQWRNWDGKKTNNFVEYEANGYDKNIKGIDQIANLINSLKTDPDSRRLIVTAWNPSNLGEAVLPPCHNMFQCYTRLLSAIERENWFAEKNSYSEVQRLEMNPNCTDEDVHQIMDDEGVPKRAISLMYNCRSQDVPLGTAFNVGSYSLLLEILAKIVNMVPDELISNMGDCHIYLNQVDGIKEQLTREAFELPRLVHMKTDDFYKSISDNISLINHLNNTDFKMEGYQSHGSIKMPLSN